MIGEKNRCIFKVVSQHATLAFKDLFGVHWGAPPMATCWMLGMLREREGAAIYLDKCMKIR